MQGDINEIVAFRFLSVDFHMLNCKWNLDLIYTYYYLLMSYFMSFLSFEFTLVSSDNTHQHVYQCEYIFVLFILI